MEITFSKTFLNIAFATCFMTMHDFSYMIDFYNYSLSIFEWLLNLLHCSYFDLSNTWKIFPQIKCFSSNLFIWNSQIVWILSVFKKVNDILGQLDLYYFLLSMQDICRVLQWNNILFSVLCLHDEGVRRELLFSTKSQNP